MCHFPPADSPGSSAGAKLYDAALQLKGLLRGRALLLVRDRADMASAAEADGLLISSGGVPIVVARRMMQVCPLRGALFYSVPFARPVH